MSNAKLYAYKTSGYNTPERDTQKSIPGITAYLHERRRIYTLVLHELCPPRPSGSTDRRKRISDDIVHSDLDTLLYCVGLDMRELVIVIGCDLLDSTGLPLVEGLSKREFNHMDKLGLLGLRKRGRVEVEGKYYDTARISDKGLKLCARIGELVRKVAQDYR